MEIILKLVTVSLYLQYIEEGVHLHKIQSKKKNHQHRQIDRINFHLILNQNYVAIRIDVTIYCVFIMNS